MEKLRVRVTAPVVMLLFFIVGVPAVSAPPNQSSSVASSLSISVIPATLPADNNTYPAIVVSLLDKSNLPTVALNDTVVYLTSSLESVGKVQSTVTIGLGKNYALANFTTTKTSGKTLVTASSTGLQSISSDVATLVARGYPTHLTVRAVPDTAIATHKIVGGLIIELQDDAGLPAKAVSDTVVNLYSSNKNVLNVPQPITTIPAGQFLRLVNYTTWVVPGSAFVTASASGYGPGSTAVTVLGLPPLALKLFAEPSQMVACNSPAVQSCFGRLVIALTDVQGNPVVAPQEITLFIRSSNLTVATIPKDQVKIAQGDISTTVNYATTNVNGTAKIIVSSPSLQSDFQQVTTNNVMFKKQLRQPVAIKLYVGPLVVLANNQPSSSIVASLLDKTGAATVNSTGPTRIVLTSSLSAVGDISQVFLTIPTGQNFATTVFTSTYHVGTTTLTASAHNLLPDQNKLATFGPIPQKIVLKTLSSSFPADGTTHSALEIDLQDSFGSPVPAPAYQPVNLTSSQNGVAKVFPTGIKVGQSFAITNVTSGVIAGTANVTAVVKLGSGYIVSSALLNTVTPAPSAIGAYVAPGKGIFDNVRGPFLVVQLQDAAGNPARAREATTVTVTSTNTTVFAKALRVILNPGADFVRVPILAKTMGTTTFTLSSPGLDSATAAMTLLARPYLVQISPVGVEILANQTATITVTAQLLGKGVKGVDVRWNASSGILSSKNGSTNAQGVATAIFTPAAPGLSTIVATLSHSILGRTNLTSTVIVIPVPVKEKPSILQLLLTFPYVLAIVGAAIGAVVGLLFMLRRKRKGQEGGEDSGFDLGVSAFPEGRGISASPRYIRHA